MNCLRISRLKKSLGLNRKVVIYGAGNFARTYYRSLIQNKIEIEYCIVTEIKDGNTYLDKIPIYPLIEKIEEIKNNNKMILIFVSNSLVAEIEDILNKYHLKKYIVMEDFIRSIYDKEGQENSEEDWIESIAEWCIDSRNLDMGHLEKVKKKINHIINEEKNEKRIVFVVGHMAPRVIKMSKALHNNGYDVRLIFYSKEILNNSIYEEIKDAHIYKLCESVEEVLYQIIISRAKILHIFSNYNNGSTSISYMLVRAKSILPKIVFEQYDVANGMYWTVEKQILKEEQFCLENSDGICCRGNEIDFLLSKLHFNITGKIIKFFDYIGDELFDNDTGEELSLCYAGYFVTEKECPDAVYACMLDFARLCAKNHCHFYLYPSVWDANRYEEYIKLNQESEYFHFHKPILYQDLVKELSHFDYEVIPYKEDFFQKEKIGTYTVEKVIYAATNKFFDGLEAGLPIIAPFPVKFADCFEKNGVLLNWTIDKFDFEQLRKRKVELKKNVKEFREQLRMKYRIHDLIDFYNSL